MSKIEKRQPSFVGKRAADSWGHEYAKQILMLPTSWAHETAVTAKARKVPIVDSPNEKAAASAVLAAAAGGSLSAIETTVAMRRDRTPS